MKTTGQENKFIFIHIPKTAGESIRKALLKQSSTTKISKTNFTSSNITEQLPFEASNLYKSARNRVIQTVLSPQQMGVKITNKLTNLLNPSSLRWLCLDKHSTAREVIQVLGEEEWHSCFTFSFVRNPYDRAVSFYHHLRKPLYVEKRILVEQYPEFWNSNLLEPKAACQAAMKYEFDEWVIRAYKYEEFEHYGWFNNQLNWLSDRNEENVVDFVGKYEDLSNSWQTICNSLGVSLDLPKVNSSNRAAYRSYYSANSRKIVESKFEKDLTFYQYEF